MGHRGTGGEGELEGMGVGETENRWKRARMCVTGVCHYTQYKHTQRYGRHM